MLVRAFFIDLSDAERDLINAGGGVALREAYHRAKDGEIDHTNFHMLRCAAEFDALDADDAYVRLQNNLLAWRDNDEIICITDFPRSMMEGDFLVWEDGRIERCARVGWADVLLSFALKPGD